MFFGCSTFSGSHWQTTTNFPVSNVEGLEETGNTDWSIPGGTLERAGNSHGHWLEGETTRSGKGTNPNLWLLTMYELG